MATEFAVIIPFRPGCPHREAAFRWVVTRWEALGVELVVGTDEWDRPWSKARAVQKAIDETTAGALVISDADVWCDHIDISPLADGRWVMPHTMVHRLDEPSTAAVLQGGEPGGTYTRNPYRGHPGGGITVVHRDLWEACPLDPRFLGWGYEDDSWAKALTHVAGAPVRGDEILWHLYHPLAERKTPDRTASKALARRYTLATRHGHMGPLLDEARTELREEARR